MSTDRKPRHVLDPEWEEALRRGQEAEGDAGSVERELEVVHLLRHLREPEPLTDARFDEILAEVAGQTESRSGWAKLARWMGKRWYVWATPLAATAALLLVVVGPGGPGGEAVTRHDAEEDAAIAAKSKEAAEAEPAEGSAAAEPRVAMAERSAQAEAIEKQFEILEARARADVDRSVESGRAATRTGLFDLAKSAGGAGVDTEAEPAEPAKARPATRSSAASGAEPAAKPASRPQADPPAVNAEPAAPTVDEVDAYEGGGK